VNLHGGQHHGYFLPGEGTSGYGARFGQDSEFRAAHRIRGGVRLRTALRSDVHASAVPEDCASEAP